MKIILWLAGLCFSALATQIVDDFFLLSFTSLVCALPLFILLESVYLVLCRVRNKPVHLVVSWTDPPVIFGSMAIWGVIAETGWPILPSKSLANFVEPGMVSVLWCVLFAVRCHHAQNGDCKKMTFWRNVSIVALPIVSVMLAFLFPGIPE